MTIGDGTAKILVVDDNEANRALARSTLEDEGYVVVLARGGVEGVELFETERPDCVLLDVRMPDLDWLRCVREDARWRPKTSPSTR